MKLLPDNIDLTLDRDFSRSPSIFKRMVPDYPWKGSIDYIRTPKTYPWQKVKEDNYTNLYNDYSFYFHQSINNSSLSIPNLFINNDDNEFLMSGTLMEDFSNNIIRVSNSKFSYKMALNSYYNKPYCIDEESEIENVLDTLYNHIINEDYRRLKEELFPWQGTRITSLKWLFKQNVENLLDTFIHDDGLGFYEPIDKVFPWEEKRFGRWR